MPDGREYVKLWTSYSAYFEPLGDAEVGRLARAMIEYKSSGAEPKFSGNERFVWPAIKRDMDEAERAKSEFTQKQSENGAKGGRPKKASGFSENPKNPSLFPETQKSQGLRTMDKGQGTKDYGQDKTEAQENTARTREAADPGLAKVMTLYMDRVQAMPSPSCIESLKSYTAELGADVVCHAIEKALDDNHRSWSYIQGILRRYSAEGLTSLEAVQASEAEFERAKERGAQAIPKTTAQRKSFSELIAERTGMK